MTSEQRLDRLERIAKLFVRAGLRARRNMKDQDEKINIIINNQIEHDERLSALNLSIDRSSKELNQSIDRTSKELNHSIDRTSKELNHSIDRSHSELTQSIKRSHNELSQSLNELAQAQIHTDRRLNSLMEIVERDRNGSSH